MKPLYFIFTSVCFMISCFACNSNEKHLTGILKIEHFEQDSIKFDEISDTKGIVQMIVATNGKDSIIFIPTIPMTSRKSFLGHLVCLGNCAWRCDFCINKCKDADCQLACKTKCSECTSKCKDKDKFSLYLKPSPPSSTTTAE